MLEYRNRIHAAAGVHRGSLDDRASRRDEPVESFALREPSDRACLGSAGADYGHAGEVDAGRLEVNRRVERRQAPFVELDAGIEEILGRTRDDHSDVDELLPIDPRNDAYYCVII